jgi:hypothetical protein
MNWDCDESIVSNKATILPCNFNSQLLAIEISAGYLRSKLDRSGYLTPLVDVGGELFRGEEISVGFGRQLLSIPYLSYQLEFKFVDAISSSRIRIEQLSTIQINQITNMYVNSTPQARETSEPIYTTVRPAQANATVPVFTIVAPRARRSALVTNKTNKTVYIKEGAAASAPTLVPADPFVSIAVGASYTVEDWSGEIVGLMSANYQAGGNIIVKELPYLVEVIPAAPAV